MIAAVSVGLSVDSSIHYITSFRLRLEPGHVCGPGHWLGPADGGQGHDLFHAGPSLRLQCALHQPVPRTAADPAGLRPRAAL